MQSSSIAAQCMDSKLTTRLKGGATDLLTKENSDRQLFNQMLSYFKQYYCNHQNRILKTL